MHKYIALEKNGSKQKKAQTEEGHTTSSSDDWLLHLLGFDLRLDCQKKKNNNHSLVERERERHSNNNELLQNKREKKERALAFLSL